MASLNTPGWNKTVYRLRGFPDTLNRESLTKAIQEALQIQPAEFKIHSFSLDTREGDLPRQKVATVTFRGTPAGLHKSGDQEWRFEIAPTAQDEEDAPSIYLDTHFKGLTPLTPENTEAKCDIDCVFVHGWGGNALGSLVADDPTTRYVWFRDDLPARFPNLRIWTYGYGSKLTDESYVSDPYEDAEGLKDALQSFRDTFEDNVPIIFIVHSLGGLVFKQAIISMSRSRNADDKQNLKLITGALFFGVPGQGMDVTALASMVYGLPSEYTLNLLNGNFGFRQRDIQDDEFHNIWLDDGFRIISFYEKRKSPTVAKTANGWSRNGQLSLLVNAASATSSRYNQQSSDSKIGLDKDHSGMIKFSRNDREEYRKVWKALRHLIDSAQSVVQERADSTDKWSTERHWSASKTLPILQSVSEKQQSELELQQRFIDELYDQVLQSRTRQISETASETYEWIFDGQDDKDSGFVEWLSNGNGIFWITGRPGAGKSTMMKFIVQHKRTRTALQAWAGSIEVVTASFYFWISGAVLQRSLTGLLQSVFHQILTYDHDLIQLLFPREWRCFKQSKHVKWTEDSFMDAVDCLKELEHDWQRKFCLFIDGLDEYQGDQDHEWLCNFLIKLGSLEHVKLCVSSRYWADFQTAFFKYPTLMLHEWTMSDVDKFIDQEFEKHSAWTELRQADPQGAASLIDEISSQAKGVFLWVCLVVRSLTRGLNKGDGLEQLMNSLFTMPKTLNGFFARILGDLEEEDRGFLAKILLICKVMRWGASIYSICLLQESDTTLDQNTLSHTDSLEKIKGMLTRTKRHLIAVASDLLILTDDNIFSGRVPEKVEFIFSHEVSLIHRTLQDYLNSPAGITSLEPYSKPFFGIHSWYHRISFTTYKILMTHLTGFDAVQSIDDWYMIQYRLSQNIIEEACGNNDILLSYQYFLELDSMLSKYFDAMFIRARHWSSLLTWSQGYKAASNFLEHAVSVPQHTEYLKVKLQDSEDVLNTIDFLGLFDKVLGAYNLHISTTDTLIESPNHRRFHSDDLMKARQMIQQAGFRLFECGMRPNYLSLESIPLHDDQTLDDDDEAFNLVQIDGQGSCTVVKTYKSNKSLMEGSLKDRFEEIIHDKARDSMKRNWCLYVNNLYILQAPHILQSPNRCWTATYPKGWTDPILL